MSDTEGKTANWFDQGGTDYARFRPDYPPELAIYLAGLAPDRGMAVDIGCGNGQLTALLASHFDSVLGLDPSVDQLASAASAPNLTYLCAPAEALPLAAATASLITAAQAAHWIDLPAFNAEACRIARPGAIIALISYGVPMLENPVLQARFDRFYRTETGPFWPPERKLVESGYRGIDFPFDEIIAPPLSIIREWDRAGFLGYVSTWSALKKARAAGQAQIADDFARDLLVLWPEADRAERISWPISMRIGRI
jgi:SAM-dependent methyltransferase